MVEPFLNLMDFNLNIKKEKDIIGKKKDIIQKKNKLGNLMIFQEKKKMMIIMVLVMIIQNGVLEICIEILNNYRIN